MKADAEILGLIKLRDKARKNRNTQKCREESGKTVRIKSSFWQQVVNDYNRRIKELQQ
jgi:hypothetical protein